MSTYSGSGARCPSCGEYEVIWMEHDPETGEQTPEDDDDGMGHSYCRNCDNGVCQYC